MFGKHHYILRYVNNSVIDLGYCTRAKALDKAGLLVTTIKYHFMDCWTVLNDEDHSEKYCPKFDKVQNRWLWIRC